MSHKGVVHWEPGGVFKTMCAIDITYYPFDEQRCNLKFGAWTYHTAKMNMSNMDTSVNTDSYSVSVTIEMETVILMDLSTYSILSFVVLL